MSSGEKQKIAVTSVLAVDPKIYVFDEPSANLDMYSVEALKYLMKRLKEEGHTVLVAEHRLYYLAELTDRLIYMKDGRIQTEWRAGEVCRLLEEERKKMGMRATNLKNIEVNIEQKEKKQVSLTVSNLSFSYRKKQIFRDISFQAHAGELIAIVGHNGAGKTTLANILCGMKKQNKRQILYMGKECKRKKRREFAYFVMQNTDCQLFGDSVSEELRLSGEKVPDHQMDELLKLYDLYEWKDCHPATLSGGHKLYHCLMSHQTYDQLDRCCPYGVAET